MKVASSYRSMQHLRELSAYLAVALLTSLFAVFPASNDSAVGDYASFNAFQGDETIVYNDLACDLGDPAVHTTAETAFEISTSAQLWEVTDCVSTSSTIFFELAGDIDLAEASSNTNLDTSSPIGFNGSDPSAPISFSGVLHGNDKTIKNIAMSIDGSGVGLFAFLESATIRNLAISGSFEGTNLLVDTEEDAAGALAIYASGVVNLYSVSNQANVTGKDNVGGLIGWTDGSVNITNTHNSGAISGHDWVGGIVGYVSEGARFTSTQNSGTVSATGAYVGGLAGEIAEVSGTGNFLNSGNHGSVSGAEKVGGLAGYVGQEVNIESASNTATVSMLGVIDQTWVYGVGGLVGYVKGNASITASHNIGAVLSVFYTLGLGDPDGTGGLLGYVTGNVTITAAHNFGPVSSQGLGRYGAFGTGGIFGHVVGHLMVIDSSNYGEITGVDGLGGLGGYAILSTFISSSSNAGTISGSSFVGGLVGYPEKGFTISGSINTGKILGQDIVGGLIGLTEGNSSILDSSNTATISAWENVVGGLVGYSRGSLTIVGSHNTGQISGLDGTGGLVGTVFALVTIINSMNSGQVSGSNNVGGLMGLQSSNALSYFENVFNSGAVSASGHAGGLAGDANTFHIVRSGNKGSVSGQGGVGGLVGFSDGGDSTFSMVGNFASVSGTFDTGGLFGSSGECAACDLYIDNFVNAGDVIGSYDPNTRTAGIVGILSGTVTALIGYSSGLVLGSFTDPLAADLGGDGVSEDSIGIFTTADSFLLSATPVSSLQSEDAYLANNWGSSLTSTWGFGSCDFNQGLPIPRVFGSILGVTEFSATGCIPVVIQDSSDESSPSSTPSYTGPTLTANNQSVFAGSTVIFSGSKLDLVTAVYVGESLVEITSKTAASITVRLPATLSAGSYDLMMHSSHGRITVMGAVVVSTGSMTDFSNSSPVYPEDLGSNQNLSDAAKLLIGKTKTIPNFAKDQNSLSTKQSAWLKESLEDSGLTRIVCTGVIMESMSMHQRIQVRKLAKATCEEAAKYLGESSVWYQSKLTTKAAYVRKVMVTFKG